MAVHFGDTICKDFRDGSRRKEYDNYCVYDGLSGIALFLSKLYLQTGNIYYKDTAVQMMDRAWTLRNALISDPYVVLGFYNGLTGLAYTLIQIGRNIHEEKYIAYGLQTVERLFKYDRQYFSADVINGIAGAIPALIKIHHAYPSPELTTFIMEIGKQLISSAHRGPIGLSWATMPDIRHNLTGHSHGVAGIVTALFELYGFTGIRSFSDAAHQGLRYERYYYNKALKNWPDFRKPESGGASDKPTYACHWCHGASGIILSRTRCYEITGEQSIFEDLYPGIETTVDHSFYDDHSNSSLCHGVLGNCDILLYAGMALNYPGLVKFARASAMEGIRLHHHQNAPWINGYSDTVPNPGLMMGLAGMGYTYLRMWNPESVPLILLIHPDDPF